MDVTNAVENLNIVSRLGNGFVSIILRKENFQSKFQVEKDKQTSRDRQRFVAEANI